METRITFRGKQYASVQEMPEELRREYLALIAVVDKDGNGVPDFLEGKGFLGKLVKGLGIQIPGPVEIGQDTTIVVDGKQYASPSEMPERVREVYQRAMEQAGLDEDQESMRSIIEGQPEFFSHHHSHTSSSGEQFILGSGAPEPKFEGLSATRLIVMAVLVGGLVVAYSQFG